MNVRSVFNVDRIRFACGRRERDSLRASPSPFRITSSSLIAARRNGRHRSKVDHREDEPIYRLDRTRVWSKRRPTYVLSSFRFGSTPVGLLGDSRELKSRVIGAVLSAPLQHRVIPRADRRGMDEISFESRLPRAFVKVNQRFRGNTLSSSSAAT